MALPTKKSRKLIINEKSYRWMLGWEKSRFCLRIEIPGGSVKTLELPEDMADGWKRPGCCGGCQGCITGKYIPITPSFVKNQIQKANL